MNDRIFASTVHFVLGALFGMLIPGGALFLLVLLASDAVAVAATFTAVAALAAGVLAAVHKDDFWEFLKRHMWWWVFFG